jgi:hypothetical protein
MREHRTWPLIRAGAPVLRRAGVRVGHAPRPARVVAKGAGERHPIGMAVGQDRLRLMRIDDHPDRLRGDPARLPDRSIRSSCTLKRRSTASSRVVIATSTP